MSPEEEVSLLRFWERMDPRATHFIDGRVCWCLPRFYVEEDGLVAAHRRRERSLPIDL